MKVSEATSVFQKATLIVGKKLALAQDSTLNETERSAISFIGNQVEKLQELAEKTGYAAWDLYTLGGEEESKRKDNESDSSFKERLSKLQDKYGDAEKAAQETYQQFKFNPTIANPILPIYKNRNDIREPFLKRQVELAYPEFSECLVDPALYKKISDIETDLAMMYGDFKALYQGKEFTDAEIEGKIKETKGASGAQEVIELVQAKLEVGNHRLKGKGLTIAETILEAVKLRNEYARKAGFPNYYSYKLHRQEINETDLVSLMSEVKIALKPMYDNLREKMDTAAIKRYGISKEDARLPWFQGGVGEPGILEDVMSFSSDGYFKGIDPRPVLKETAKSIGTDADFIVDKSDLFPRPGKNPHWSLWPLKTPTDIRSLGNIDPTFQSRMGYAFSTELHEVLGHGVGYSLIEPQLPSIFKNLHTIVTESDAMMMEDLLYNEHWLREAVKFDENKIQECLTLGNQYKLADGLVKFFHNYLLITDFEREMYNLKDEELTLNNVNKLWVRKSDEYLGIKIPNDRNKPDWTYKIHFATAPVYYQCYFLGQLMRAQIHAKIDELAPQRGLFSKETGDYLKEYRGVGESYPWNELIKYMTGKPLGVDALKSEFKALKLV